MNFQYSLEQDMLRSSVASTFGRYADLRESSALGELGIFGLLVQEENGGLELGLVEAAIVLAEAGRSGRGGSLAETLLSADALVRTTPERRDAILAGDTRVVAPIAGALTRTEDRLVGKITLARPGDSAWIVIPIARDTTVALLPAVRFEPTQRASLEAEADACEIVIDVSATETQVVAFNRFADRLAILRCAELLGAADHCFQLSIQYLKDRSQFGQPIGANQALKHIAADTYLALENVRVAVEYAAAASDAADRSGGDLASIDAAIQAVRVMLAYVPVTAREIAETTIHLHGGIGLTWEYPLNAYIRRIVRLGMALGSPSERRIALFDDFCRSAEEESHRDEGSS